jgi:N6-L-threonylcarbamoyladenine synthase
LGDFDDPPSLPHGCLVVSGGHTELVKVSAIGVYEILGETIDDAAGEAFDKAARLLGLGYPGGAAIQRLAERGQPRYALPKGLSGHTLDFSFSGFKTAVMRLVEREADALDPSDAAASIQETIAGVLTERALRAAEDHDLTCFTLVGGVAANKRLRELLAEGCRKRGIRFVTPPFELCTDNAAMIGIAAAFRLARGERDEMDLDCFPNAELA